MLVGPDHLFAAVSAMGGDGVVSGNAQIIPAYYKKIWQLLQEKNYEEAAKWQHRTNLLNETLCENNNIAAYKVMLKRDGIIATTKMRRPMENLTPEQEGKFDCGNGEAEVSRDIRSWLFTGRGKKRARN